MDETWMLYGRKKKTDIEDEKTHGTHIISEIIAVKDNDIGVIGIIPAFSIVLAKAFGSDRYNVTETEKSMIVLEGIHHVLKKGKKGDIVN